MKGNSIADWARSYVETGRDERRVELQVAMAWGIIAFFISLLVVTLIGKYVGPVVREIKDFTRFCIKVAMAEILYFVFFHFVYTTEVHKISREWVQKNTGSWSWYAPGNR